MLKYSENYPHGISLVSDSILKKTARANSKEQFNNIKKIVKYFISNPNDLVVPLYSFKFDIVRNNYYNPGSVSIMDMSINHYSYSYDMKRLFILSEEERDIIDLCLRRNCSFTEKKKLKVSESIKDYSDLMKFIDKIKKWDVYWDRHSGNFLKNEMGDYQVIDIEGFSPLSQWKSYDA
jgi:hypothetical protein